MRATSKSIFFAAMLLSATVLIQPASSATKVAGQTLVMSGCQDVSTSLLINQAFFALPEAQQTEARKKRATAAQDSLMADAMKAFKAAAKINQKWNKLATNIDRLLRTDKAEEFTKSFGVVLSTCTALKPTKTSAVPKVEPKK